MKRIFQILFVTLLSSSPVWAADDQPDGMPPTVSALVESIGALTKSSATMVDSRLATVRAYKIRQQLSNYLLEGDLNGVPNFPGDESLLCDPRKKQIVLQSSITYLNAVTAQVKAVAKSDITSDVDVNNIVRAFKSLFADYRIDVDTPGANIEAKVLTDCKASLENFALQYYGISPSDEAGIVAAFTAIYEIFKSVIAPVIVEGAKYIDETRRLDKVRQYLKTDANRKLIIANAGNLSDAMTKYESGRMAEAVGHFVEAQLALKNGFKKAKAIEECKNLDASADNRKIGSSVFRGCFAAIWAANKENVTAVTTEAAKYDQLADIGVGQGLEQLKAITTSLEKIAKNEDDPVTFNSIWKAAMRLMTIAQKIEVATTKENRDKITKAVKDVIDAL